MKFIASAALLMSDAPDAAAFAGTHRFLPDRPAFEDCAHGTAAKEPAIGTFTPVFHFSFCSALS
jgi:hypothetical protein